MELLLLVCLCLLSCSGDAVRVVVEEDSDAVLPCLISTEEDLTGKLFDWKKDGQEKKEVFLYDAGIHYNNGRQGQDEQFKGRVSFFQDQLQNGDASIKITGTKMADSGTYNCDFPRHQPRQTSIIELVVDPVLKDRTGENIPGLAPEPVINIHDVTKDGVLLHCKARGVSPLTVEMKDGAGNILNSESTPKSERGSTSYIALNIAVTKTDNYSCVATQEQFSHQVTAMIPVNISAVRVVVEEGSDAVLPCLISTEEDISYQVFDWRKDGQMKKEVFMYNAGIHSQDEQFKGRVSFFQDQLQNGNASIKITRTKMADSGIYRCDFPRHQQSQTSIIELVVGAAPEPVIKILDETNHWCLLQCEAHGDPLPTLEWKDSDNNTLPADTPQISVRGGRSYITVNVTVTKTGRYRCVATQETLSHQIPALTYVRLPGAASKPSVTLDQTEDGLLLQCEVLGASPKPKVEWKDSSGNILPVKDLKETERGDSYDIVLQMTVTKTDRYRCVVTQEEINHQIYAEIYVPLNGSNTGLVATIVVLILLLVVAIIVAGVLAVLYIKKSNKQYCAKDKKKSDAVELNPADQNSTPLTTGST